MRQDTQEQLEIQGRKVQRLEINVPDDVEFLVLENGHLLGKEMIEAIIKEFNFTGQISDVESAMRGSVLLYREHLHPNYIEYKEWKERLEAKFAQKHEQPDEKGWKKFFKKRFK